LLKEYKAIAKSHAVKVIFAFAFDEEDSLEDVIDDHMTAKLDILSVFHCSY